VVDDEPSIVKVLTDQFIKKNYEVAGFTDAEKAFKWGKKNDFDLLIADLKIPTISGIDLHERLKLYYPDLLTILITGYESMESALRAISANVYAYITKPFNMVDLITLCEKALEKKELLDRNRRLTEDQQDLIEKLLVANKELKKLDVLKNNFVANVSHELRTPITSMRTVLYNFEQGIAGTLTDKQSEYVKMMQQDVQRLQDLIQDILDLSKLESKSAALKLSQFKASDMVRSVLDLFERSHNEKGIKFYTELAPGFEELTLEGDRSKLEQVLINLLNNAVKFSADKKRIWIRGLYGENHVSLAIQDEGIGISKYDQPHIFNRFAQLEKMASGRVEGAGAGLGLAIAKRIVEMHKGMIAVKSEVGKGSTFTVAIPLSQTENQYLKKES